MCGSYYRYLSNAMNFFEGNPDFEKVNGVFCQKNFSKKEFEEAYVDIRTKEGRMYDDATVAKLPFVTYSKEWSIRAASAGKLVKQLRKENCKSLIEVGCGNGWLANYIQRELDIEACGIDVEKLELEQAARVGKNKIAYAYADIFSLKGMKADVVLLASCIQYFQDLPDLIAKLRKVGTIHIIDSPFYEEKEVAAARQRSSTYFDSKLAWGMKHFYFHHTIDSLMSYNPTFLHRPNRLLKIGSPFPWIRIDK